MEQALFTEYPTVGRDSKDSIEKYLSELHKNKSHDSLMGIFEKSAWKHSDHAF